LDIDQKASFFTAVYSEYPWRAFLFGRLRKRSWKDEATVDFFLIFLERTLRLSTIDDWRSLTIEELARYGAEPLYDRWPQLIGRIFSNSGTKGKRNGLV